MDAQVAVGRPEQALQIVERQALVHGERADDAQPQPLVNQPIELQRTFLRQPRGIDRRRATDCGRLPAND